jgi:hypothetical protein
METNKHWITNSDDMLKSLLGDEAKNKAILADMEATIRQLKAKSTFRLALLNALIENRENNK